MNPTWQSDCGWVEKRTLNGKLERILFSPHCIRWERHEERGLL